MLTVSPRTVSRVAWGVLGYTVLVILWGAFVRASGSGAGCGAHWPLCNGEVVPTAPALSTVVEFGHRVTSALAGVAALVLVAVVFRGTPKGSPVRKAAVASLVFMVLEGGIGAALVLFEYVAYNPSIGRAIWMAAHLTNTFLLLGALTLTAWWSEGMETPRLGVRPAVGWVAATLAATLVLGAGGAVTALGDTLVLGGGIDPATDPVVAALLGARVFHPTMAFLTLAVLGAAVIGTRSAGRAKTLGMALVGGFLAQMALGALNVALLAPIWLQIVHLLMTDLIWIAMVIWASEVLAAPIREPAMVAA
ncbi:COX15/CtaA family protein [Rubrivirga sp.]|uniref:COX15/CtaA family protein n=1 Tax=Rubrivirga sp. TaxID=1885344 RepID=UPI003B51DEE5